MKRNKVKQLFTGILIAAMIICAVPFTAAAADGPYTPDYDIEDYYKDYYDEDTGYYSEKALLETYGNNNERWLEVKLDDIIKCGDWIYQVTIDEYPLYLNSKLDYINYFNNWAYDLIYNNVNPPLHVLVGFDTRVLTEVKVEAIVEKLQGNQNRLIITVTEIYSNGETIDFVYDDKIYNNAADTYLVGDKYKVFVDTKGNTQIRDICIL